MSLLLESDIQIGVSSVIVSIADPVVEEPEKVVEEAVAEVVVVSEKPAKRKK
jgi:hypothetical protein